MFELVGLFAWLWAFKRTFLRGRKVEMNLPVCEEAPPPQPSKTGDAVRRGRRMEQLAPLLSSDFEGDIRFLGGPVDYVVFKPDGTVEFVEVKTGQSNLSVKQEKIKRAVESGKVTWRTLRL